MPLRDLWYGKYTALLQGLLVSKSIFNGPTYFELKAVEEFFPTFKDFHQEKFNRPICAHSPISWIQLFNWIEDQTEFGLVRLTTPNTEEVDK